MTRLILPTLILTLAAAIHPAAAQRTRYVTDELRLESRTGPSTSHRIVSMLDSGEAVTVLEESEGWSRIALPGGNEAWILTRYLMDEPAARNALTAAFETRDAAVAERDRLAQTLAELQGNARALGESREALAQQNEALSRELAQVKQAAASTLAIREQNAELEQAVQALRSDLESARREVIVLRDTRERDWFVAGAGVLLGGMILGLIIPKIRWKRRRSWGEL